MYSCIHMHTHIHLTREHGYVHPYVCIYKSTCTNTNTNSTTHITSNSHKCMQQNNKQAMIVIECHEGMSCSANWKKCVPNECRLVQNDCLWVQNECHLVQNDCHLVPNDCHLVPLSATNEHHLPFGTICSWSCLEYVSLHTHSEILIQIPNFAWQK